MSVACQQTGYADIYAFGRIGVGIFDEEESLGYWAGPGNRSAADAVDMVDFEWGSRRRPNIPTFPRKKRKKTVCIKNQAWFLSTS